MKMKKILCLILALVMVLAMLAGCDSKKSSRDDDDDDDDDSRTNHSSSLLKPGKDDDGDDAADGDAAAGDNADADDSVTDMPANSGDVSAEEPTTEPAEEESNLSMGRLEGDTYINEYAGFICKMDDSWQFYSAQELQELPEQISEATKGSELNKLLNGLSQFTDMMAENTTELVSVNMVYTNLTAQMQAVTGYMDEETAIDMVLQQAETLEAYYSAAGITVYSMEKVKVNFLGEEHFAVYSVMDLQGIPYYTLQLMNYSLGEYGLTLTLASYVDDKTTDLLELFEPLK